MPLTLVVGGDSPSAVMDFSSIFSSLLSSTAGFSITSCFFSGLAVLAGQQEKNPEMDVYWNDSGQWRQELLLWSSGGSKASPGSTYIISALGTSELLPHNRYRSAGAPWLCPAHIRPLPDPSLLLFLNQRIVGLT